METLALRPLLGLFSRLLLRLNQAKQSITIAMWVAILVVCYLLSECAESIKLPSPQLLVALLVGATLALTGVLKRRPPKRLTTASHALVGVLMGSYLDRSALKSVVGTALPLVLITAATIGVSVGVGVLLARSRHFTLPDAVLGMIPGGSAAIIACAFDAGSDARFVAFAQYLRVGLVALTAPFLAFSLGGAVSSGPDLSTMDFPAFGHLAVATGQFSSLIVLTGVCLLGVQLGKRLSLPAPALLGSMIVAALATVTQAASGFAPAGPLRDVIFLVVGLEVGLRFTRSSIRQVGKALPLIVAATVAICLMCAGLALAFAAMTGLPFLEVYLATTPGGINAVLATANSTTVHTEVVSTVQSFRLFTVCLLGPTIVRLLVKRTRHADFRDENAIAAKETLLIIK
jgi:hypothetical protein